MNNTLCYWSREKNQEGLMCFLGVLCVFFGVWNREKCVEKPEKEQKIRKMSSFSV